MDKLQKGNIHLQKWVVSVGILLMLLKFIAFYLTASNSILSDALESIVNVIAGSFTLYALWYSAKPKDLDHPYGHGKIEFISAGIEGSLIVLVGGIIIYKSIYNFFQPQNLVHIDWGMYLTILAGLVNFVLGFLLVRRGKSANSLALIAGGKHLLSDAYTTVALLGGLLLILITKWQMVDNIFAIVMAIYIIYEGVRIIRKALAGIMDELDAVVVDEVVAVLENNRKPEWIDIHNLRIIKYGAKYHIDCHATLPWYFDLRQSHEEVEAIRKTIEKHSKNDVELFIHTDPCEPFSCEICFIANCEVRRHPQSKQLHWTKASLLSNKKHHIATDSDD